MTHTALVCIQEQVQDEADRLFHPDPWTFSKVRVNFKKGRNDCTANGDAPTIQSNCTQDEQPKRKAGQTSSAPPKPKRAKKAREAESIPDDNHEPSLSTPDIGDLGGSIAHNIFSNDCALNSREIEPQDSELEPHTERIERQSKETEIQSDETESETDLRSECQSDSGAESQSKSQAESQAESQSEATSAPPSESQSESPSGSPSGSQSRDSRSPSRDDSACARADASQSNEVALRSKTDQAEERDIAKAQQETKIFWRAVQQGLTISYQSVHIQITWMSQLEDIRIRNSACLRSRKEAFEEYAESTLLHSWWATFLAGTMSLLLPNGPSTAGRLRRGAISTRERAERDKELRQRRLAQYVNLVFFRLEPCVGIDALQILTYLACMVTSLPRSQT